MYFSNLSLRNDNAGTYWVDAGFIEVLREKTGY